MTWEWDDMDECKHGMNPEWCADCKGMKTPEEQAELENLSNDRVFDQTLERWAKRVR